MLALLDDTADVCDDDISKRVESLKNNEFLFIILFDDY